MLLAAALEETGLSGRYHAGTLAEAERRTLLATLVDRGRYDLEAAARATFDVPAAFADGESFAARVGRWADRAWSYLRGLRLAAVFALVGPGPLSPVEADALRKAEAQQRGYFDPFVDAARSGEQAPTGIPARIAQYASAAWGTGVNAARGNAIASGLFTQERRIMGSEHPCRVCTEEAAKGWSALGSLRDIGDSPCGANCRCHVEFR